ncbi:hypothetical protein K7432_008613 [Basidiobolus ranarum]|uniref:UBC core domain-containing protein n=1 Tax=Basidiobolus ranarum TaxID=34480 RepID=A0ABR2WRJ2_9FUNG
MNKQLVMRMKKELELLECDPPPGIMCWPVDDILNRLSARIKGPKDTPYEDGIFQVEVQIPDRYPFEPPKAQFVTPIYHPNIDNQGRICLDILKMPPKGSWKPSLNISTMLTSLLVLMSEPNPDDPLLVEVAKEYCENRSLFLKKARDCTKSYANENNESKIESNSNTSLSPSDSQALHSDNNLGGSLYSLPVSPETSSSYAPDSSSSGKRSLVELLKKRPRNDSSDTNASSEEAKTTCIVKKPKTFSLTTKRKISNSSPAAKKEATPSEESSLPSTNETSKHFATITSKEPKPECNKKMECTIIASDSDEELSTTISSNVSSLHVKSPLVMKTRRDTDKPSVTGPKSKDISSEIPKGKTSKTSEKHTEKNHIAGTHTGTFEVIELSDSSEEEVISEQPKKAKCTIDIDSNAQAIAPAHRSLNLISRVPHDSYSSNFVTATSPYFEATTSKTEISTPSCDRTVKQPVKDKRSLLKLKPKPVKIPRQHIA